MGVAFNPLTLTMAVPERSILDGGPASGKVVELVPMMYVWHRDEETGAIYEYSGELKDGLRRWSHAGGAA